MIPLRWRRALFAFVAAGCLSSCTIPTNDEPQIIGIENVPAALLETTTTTTTTTPQSPTKDEIVYFVRRVDGQTTLVPVIRRYPVGAPINVVLDDLISRGPDRDGVERPDEAELTTSIIEVELVTATPPETPGVLTVDVVGLFGDAAAEGPVQVEAAAQIALTALEDELVTGVLFLNDGEPVGAPVPGADLRPDEPVDRSHYASLLSPG